jgi:hypothetical protein
VIIEMNRLVAWQDQVGFANLILPGDQPVHLDNHSSPDYSPDAAVNGRPKEYDAQAGRSWPRPVGTRPLVNNPG